MAAGPTSDLQGNDLDLELELGRVLAVPVWLVLVIAGKLERLFELRPGGDHAGRRDPRP
jgi:hypothetical protein